MRAMRHSSAWTSPEPALFPGAPSIPDKLLSVYRRGRTRSKLSSRPRLPPARVLASFPSFALNPVKLEAELQAREDGVCVVIIVPARGFVSVTKIAVLEF